VAFLSKTFKNFKALLKNLTDSNKGDGVDLLDSNKGDGVDLLRYFFESLCY
jgi:hypothetical protein